MKLVHSIYVCPSSFKTFGPVCLEFDWDIFDDRVWDWMEKVYPSDAGPRIQMMTERMIRVQPIRAYFDTLDDAILFKLTWGGI